MAIPWKRKRFAILFIVSALFFSISMSSAYAAVVSSKSATTKYKYSKRTWAAQSSIYNYGGKGGLTFTSIFITKGKMMPTGSFGVRPRSYKASGALCTDDGYFYNDGRASGIVRGIDAAGCGKGNYYGRGRVANWNGHGYTTRVTPRTRNVYFKS